MIACTTDMETRCVEYLLAHKADPYLKDVKVLFFYSKVTFV